MAKPLDLHGQIIGDLSVLGRSPAPYNSIYWVCRCGCGRKFTATGSQIRLRRIVSCGCKKKRRAATLAKKTHGMTQSPEFSTWSAMRRRCTEPSHVSFRNYGGRGIKVCDEWASDFARFYEDMGPKPSKDHTIERIDVNGDYCPANCCWLHKSLQGKNKRK